MHNLQEGVKFSTQILPLLNYFRKELEQTTSNEDLDSDEPLNEEDIIFIFEEDTEAPKPRLPKDIKSNKETIFSVKVQISPSNKVRTEVVVSIALFLSLSLFVRFRTMENVRLY